MNKLLLRPEEAAELIGVGRSKLYKMVALGVVPSVRLGGRSLRVPASALKDWVRRAAAQAIERTHDTVVKPTNGRPATHKTRQRRNPWAG